jgi:hypothetical protein
MDHFGVRRTMALSPNSAARRAANDPGTGEEIDKREIVKGYEYGRGQFVTLTPEELKALDVESSKVIDLEKFASQTIGVVPVTPRTACAIGVGSGYDHIGVAVDNLAGEIGIACGPALAGIPLDGEVLSLDMAQPAQLFEKLPPNGIADVGDVTCGNDDRNPVLLRRSLRPRRSRHGGE